MPGEPKPTSWQPPPENLGRSQNTVTEALKDITFRDSGSNPRFEGQLRRNGPNLLWYDGSSVVTLNSEVVASLFISSVLTPAQITANQNNYNPTGYGDTYSILRLASDAARNITGLLVPTAITDGKVVIIFNVGGFNITLVDESASSTAANRFALSAGIVIAPDDSAMLWYDITSLRWRLVSRS